MRSSRKFHFHHERLLGLGWVNVDGFPGELPASLVLIAVPHAVVLEQVEGGAGMLNRPFRQTLQNHFKEAAIVLATAGAMMPDSPRFLSRSSPRHGPDCTPSTS